MKIKIYVIDMEIPPRAKRWALRLGGVAAALGLAAVAFAAVPLHQWKTGDPLSAADLNDNFAKVTTVSYDGGAYSVGPTGVVGVTAAKTPGDMSGFTFGTGYAAAKKACEASFQSMPTVHMCTGEEIVRAAQTGWVPSFARAAWYSGGVYWEVTTASPVASVGDCHGWTSGASTDWGSDWYASPSQPSDDGCSLLSPILCCN
jgi:hypothetical protein